MENLAVWNKTYTVEERAPILAADPEAMISLSFNLTYQATLRVRPIKLKGAKLPEAELLKWATDCIRLAYGSVYRDGMPISAVQNARPEEAVVTEARNRLNEVLDSIYGAALDSFEIVKQSLSPEDQALLSSVLEQSELRDPRKAAEKLLRDMQAEIDKLPPEKRQWSCACGRTNSTRFCPECGKPAPYMYLSPDKR